MSSPDGYGHTEGAPNLPESRIIIIVTLFIKNYKLSLLERFQEVVCEER